MIDDNFADESWAAARHVLHYAIFVSFVKAAFSALSNRLWIKGKLHNPPASRQDAKQSHPRARNAMADQAKVGTVWGDDELDAIVGDR